MAEVNSLALGDNFRMDRHMLASNIDQKISYTNCTMDLQVGDIVGIILEGTVCRIIPNQTLTEEQHDGLENLLGHPVFFDAKVTCKHRRPGHSHLVDAMNHVATIFTDPRVISSLETLYSSLVNVSNEWIYCVDVGMQDSDSSWAKYAPWHCQQHHEGLCQQCKTEIGNPHHYWIYMCTFAAV